MKIFKNKKGSHVGMILSFVIFITFLIFLYSIISPVTKIEKEKKFLLNYLESSIKEKFSADLTTVSFIINNSTIITPICIEMNNTDILSNIQGKDSIIKNENKNILNYTIPDQKNWRKKKKEKNEQGEIPKNIYVNLNDSKDKFFKIYSSKEFPFRDYKVQKNLCTKVPNKLITMGLVKKRKYIFESKIIRTIKEYKNGSYDGLKKGFNLPPEVDFGFSFTDNNYKIIDTGESIFQGVNIYSNEIPIQYIDNKSNILQGFINLRIW